MIDEIEDQLEEISDLIFKKNDASTQSTFNQTSAQILYGTALSDSVNGYVSILLDEDLYGIDVFDEDDTDYEIVNLDPDDDSIEEEDEDSNLDDEELEDD